MVSIRDLLSESLAIGETFCLELEQRDDLLVADHPYAASPMDVAVVEGVERLEERPPTDPVEVEIVGRIVDDRIAGRVVGLECDDDSTRGDRVGVTASER
ncbi:hypothetical protein ACFOZ7_21585 [Natribaculum luteum]|uniref:Uncharacterized protein n=1 Tax=Natribaculum luteum TaxID=1586232 RepID=A0ABD5P5B4_9EURY|nr:hypothetical protein [Natribaculum luteum]